MGELTLILGPARSGKSSLAVEMARRDGGSVLYIATSETLDDEMRERAAKHRAGRPDGWTTLEEPLDLPARLLSRERFDVYVLDCATVWVSNLLLSRGEGAAWNERLDRVAAAVEGLIRWQRAAGTELIVVSNEVGASVVPEYELGRLYRDALGRTNQLLAAAADRFYCMVAGFYLDMKAVGARRLGDKEDRRG